MHARAGSERLELEKGAINIKGFEEGFDRFIHFDDLKQFEEAVRRCTPTVIYRWKKDGSINLGFVNEGFVNAFEIPGGFPGLTEYFQAKKEGFSGCTFQQWGRLKELGYRNMAEVDRDRGGYDIDQWLEIRSLGFSSSEDFDRENGTPITSEKKGDKDAGFMFSTAIIDGNNISYGDYEDTPRLENILCVYRKLKALGVKPYVVVSAALRHKIDDPAGLVEFLKQDDVAEAPAQRYDDFFVIQLAFEREAFIVSNDRFVDWKRANPDMADEIERRRVALTFIEDEPQFDQKLYTLIHVPERERLRR